jgi:hypothetical protein
MGVKKIILKNVEGQKINASKISTGFQFIIEVALRI